MIRLLVAALAVALSAQPAAAIPCDDLKDIRSRADAGEVASQGFLNGWLAGVMNMSGIHVANQMSKGRPLDYCVEKEALLHSSYMTYERLLSIYDRQMNEPRVKIYLSQHPEDCSAEAIAFMALSAEFPCQ